MDVVNIVGSQIDIAKSSHTLGKLLNNPPEMWCRVTDHGRSQPRERNRNVFSLEVTNIIPSRDEQLCCSSVHSTTGTRRKLLGMICSMEEVMMGMMMMVGLYVFACLECSKLCCGFRVVSKLV